jgi:hypothetical protein
MGLESMAKSGVVIVPLIVGIIQAVKASFPADRPFPRRCIPALSVSLGMAISAVVNWGDCSTVVLQGLAFGLSAIGLYSGTANTLRK